MPQPTITDVRITGLHGQQSITVALKPGLNIVHAKNGVGKTTLLHVLANLAEREIDRFLYIRFERITVKLSSGVEIELRQVQGADPSPVRVQLAIDGVVYDEVAADTPPSAAGRKLLADAFGNRPVYLPAFRSILEAVSQRRRYEPRDNQAEAFRNLVGRELNEAGVKRNHPAWFRAREGAELTASKTFQCREWFGAFVPVIRCPSVAEVSDELTNELMEANYKVVNTDVEVSGHVFVEVLRAVLPERAGQGGDSKPVDALLKNIREYLGGLPEHYKVLSTALDEMPNPTFRDRETIAKILSVYEQALSKRVNEGRAAYRRIETFLESVNMFLERPKRLVVDARAPVERDFARPRIAVDSGNKRMHLQVLSSGERQVLLLLFSATHMSSGDGMLLIDEPELSLHLGWQRYLLRELMAQAGERQVIVCTHAPELAADYHDEIRDLELVTWVPHPTQGELELPEDKDSGPLA